MENSNSRQNYTDTVHFFNTLLGDDPEPNANSNTLLEARKSDEKPDRKTCLERYFGPIKGGSIRASIITMSIQGLGSGILAIPKKMNEMSFFLCALFIVLSALACYLTMKLLIIASERKKFYNYSEFVKHLYNPSLSVLLDVMIIFNIFGLVTLYQIICYQQIGSLVYDLGQYSGQFVSIEAFLAESFWGEIYWKAAVMYSIGGLVLLPLCLLENIAKMWFTTLFLFFAMLFTIGVIIVQLPWYLDYYWESIYRESDASTHLNFWDMSRNFDPQYFAFMTGMTTMVYTYAYHWGCFPVYKCLSNNLFRRMDKVITRSFAVNIILNLLVAIFGYLTQPVGTPNLIIDRYRIFESDWVMLVAKSLIIVGLSTKIPACYNSMRISIVTLIFGSEELTRLRNWSITLVTLVFSILIGVFYSNVTDYISIIGGLSGNCLAFVFPCLIYIKAGGYEICHWKNVCVILLCTIMSLVNFFGVGVTINNIVNNVSTGH